MKKIKLFLAALAAMVTMGVNAQTWVASEVGAGNFYLYNIGKGQFLTRGNGWGTQASTGASALTLVVEEYDGAYKLRTNVNGDGKGLERLGDPVIYTDQSNGKNSTWTFTKVSDASNGPVYTIVSKDNHEGGSGSYMTASADNTIVAPADAVSDDYGHWQLIQSWITNSMPVADANGWTTSQTPTFDSGNICAEYWNKSGASIKQTVSGLPAGKYELIAVALTRDGMTATLNAGTNTKSIATAATSTVNNRTQAKSWFDAGNGVNNLEFTHAGGNLEIGLTADNATGDHWLVWRSFILLYKGVDLSELKVALQAKIDAVPALQGTTTTAAYNAAKEYADAIVMDNLKTVEAISEVSTELTNRINTATALQTNYSRYYTIRTAALAINAELNTTDADTAVEAATTNDAIDAAIATLRAAFVAAIGDVEVPEDPGYIDVTAVMVDNASVSTNTDYWTAVENGSAKTSGSWAVCNYGECEFYNNNFKFYQTLGLNIGTWEFGVTGFHRAGNHSTYFYAGDDKILIPGVESTKVNSMEEAKTYFDNGNGKVSLKFIVESASNIEIGINNQDTKTDKWTIFRNFTLKYYGAPDYSVYVDQWNKAVEDAEAAKMTYPNVTGTELTALDNAIADEPDGSCKDNYLEKIQALQTATNTFTAAAPSYDKYVAYRAETVALFGEELASTVDEPTSAAETSTAVQNLNIAQYNKVATDYTYSLNGLNGDFGSWEGTATVAGEKGDPNYLNWEHWSGTTHAYYEQDADGYGNANGWTIRYQKTTTLSAGNYVLKVAARSSSGVTSSVSCSATATTISLPCNGNRTRGINTSGVASWSDGDTFVYANGTDYAAGVGGSGAGWEWRFLPFTLAEETEVTMTFYAEASTGSQWMSIGDAELLSDEEKATAVAYDEESTNTIEDVTVANVTMTRTIKEGFNTVVLPFTLTANQVTTAFGAGTVVYNYTEASTDGNDATVNFNSGDGSITANKPVLVKATAASTEQTFNGVQIVAPDAETGAKVAGENFDFKGVYAPAEITAGDWFIGNGALYQSTGSTSIKAFRAFIEDQNPEAGVKALTLNIDGITTGIATIKNGEMNIEEGAIYNIAGQRLNKLQKGINIVNGKKVVVK